MEQTQNELSLEESFAEVMAEMPSPVRLFVMQRKYSVVASRLMGKYRLTQEQGIILEREIILLVMKIEDVKDFEQALSEEARIDTKTIESILVELEEQIFTPLSEQIEKEEEEKVVQEAPLPVPKPVVPAPVAAPASVPPVPTPAPKPAQVPVPNYSAPPLQSPRYIRAESQNIDTLVPQLAPNMATSRPAVTLGIDEVRPMPQKIMMPQMPAEAEKVPVPPAPTPAPLAPKAPVVAPAIAPTSAPTPAPTPVAPPAVPTNPAPAGDPYREPIGP